MEWLHLSTWCGWSGYTSLPGVDGVATPLYLVWMEWLTPLYLVKVEWLYPSTW